MWPFKKKEYITDLTIKGSMNKMEEYILSIRGIKDRSNLYTLFALATLESYCRGMGTITSSMDGSDVDKSIDEAIEISQKQLDKDCSKSNFTIFNGGK